MPIEPIIPPGSPPPLAPYSPGTKAGGFLYVSGTLAIGPNGETMGIGDAAAQTRYVLDSIKAVLEAGGGSLKSVVFNQIFLKDLADYASMNAVYKEYFPEAPPARYCIQAPLVRPDFLVEIATTAYVGD
ncbi:Rid family hydrolase [Belnapia rosea]|uniref:Aminoacrylate peracid reductase n=1 Tax=Belnapia rosea TaxID=938405 RepID=A0A1G6KVY4_9PROT|nr:Rid family hydrolase [Belnapia rosea]SDC35107.1 aminoacrylate peracid reductase [Belnapia rosea]